MVCNYHSYGNVGIMISLKSKITQKLLTLFFFHQDKKYYVNELSRIIKQDCSNTYKKLMEMKQEGLLLAEFHGKQRYFFINQGYELLKDYQRLFLNDLGLEKRLLKLKQVDGVSSAYIFGAYANQNLSSDKEINILLVGDFNSSKASKIILNIQQEIGRELYYAKLTEKEFLKQKKKELKTFFSSKFIQVF